MFSTLMSEVLVGLTPVLGTGIAHVGPWVGEPTEENFEALAAAATPSIFVGISSSTINTQFSQNESFSGKQHQTVASVEVVVLCLVAEARDISDMIYKNSSGSVSVLGACDLVIAQLNGLRVSNAVRKKPLVFRRAAPYFFSPSNAFVVYAVYFGAEIVLAQRRITDSEAGNPTDFDGVDVVINRTGSVDVDTETVPQPDPLNPLQNPRVEIEVDE